MALIFEIKLGREDVAHSRHGLHELPVTIGRALGNSIILDDPYVDGLHARIINDDGTLVVEDLHSKNGMWDDNANSKVSRISAAPGVVVRMGRTLLRFRDTEETVAPALADGDSDIPSWLQWVTSIGGMNVLICAAVIILTILIWSGTSDRSSGVTIFGMVLGFLSIGILWAFCWSIIGRLKVRQFHFMGHSAIAGIFVIAAILASIFLDWLEFFFPNGIVIEGLDWTIHFVLLAALYAFHLRLSSHASRRQRWRRGITFATVISALLVIGKLLDVNNFSANPEFTAVVKPIGSYWLPKENLDDFEALSLELKKKVDKLAESQLEKH